MVGNIKVLLGLALLLLLVGCTSVGEDYPNLKKYLNGREVILYKSNFCGCCEAYASYLEENGIRVKVVSMENLEELKNRIGIPMTYWSCHTVDFGDFIVEGHVPLRAIEIALRENIDFDVIALPGMPAGSPGMGGVKQGKFEISLLKNGEAVDNILI